MHWYICKYLEQWFPTGSLQTKWSAIKKVYKTTPQPKKGKQLRGATDYTNAKQRVSPHEKINSSCDP